MYSFAQRADIRVVDEPLYGHYLRVSGARHPGRDEILAAMNCNGEKVMTSLLQAQAADDSKILFMKHMAHHLIDLDLKFLHLADNIFLIREPRQMLPSLILQIPQPTLGDTGLQRQWQLYSDLAAAGHTAVVVDSRQLLLDPEMVLRKLCERIGLKFCKEMLRWSTGPRTEDGIWAPHWYHAVHQSTGFSPYRPKSEIPIGLEPLLAQCERWYDKLYAHAIRTDL